MEWLDQIITVAVVIVLFCVYVYKKHSYWKEHGIPQPPTTFLLGHFLFEKKNQISQTAQMHDFYHRYKAEAPFVGLYMFLKPAILVTDVEMIKNVLAKDFDHFVDHGFYYNEKDDPVSASLFNVNEVAWRKLRTSLTPTFTSAKMKLMFGNVCATADNNLIRAFDQLVTQHPGGFEVKDLMSRFTTDVIGDCIFGLQCNSFEDPTNEFRRMGTLSFKRTLGRTLKINLTTVFPDFARFLGIKRIRPEVAEFFTKIVTEAVEYREKNDVQRNDFLNLLIGLKNHPKNESDRFTMWQVISQSFVFFTAGFETSSTTLTYLLYEMAVNEDIQEKLREHIMEVLEKYEGKLTYEALHDLTYMENCIHETLRKYPVLSIMNRKVTKDYKIPDTDVVLERGTSVLLPVRTIHYDPDIHRDPEVFNPDRFNADQKMHACAYLGFGYGNRNCIGMRFGMMQMKVGLVRLFSQFRFERAIDTEVPLRLDHSRPTVTPISGVPLKVSRL